MFEYILNAYMIMIKWPFYDARICESNSQQVFAPKFWISHLCEQIFSLNIALVLRPYWNIWQKKSTERNNVATVEADFFSVLWIIWACIWKTIEVNGNCDKPCSFHSSVEISKSKRGIYFLKLFKHHIIILWYDMIVHKTLKVIHIVLSLKFKDVPYDT